MKIGIITIQKAPENYGACLQCYSLWAYLTKQGNDCEVIDLLRPWHPKYIKSDKDNKNVKRCVLFLLLKYIVNIFRRKKKYFTGKHWQNFCDFNKRIKYSKEYRSVEDLYTDPPLYDIYIAGSDQIWNPFMSFVNEPYFLTFAPSGKKKIAYASSFAVSQIPEEKVNEYAKWLNDFSYLSVREKSGVSIINTILKGKDAVLVLDPVFLLFPNEWEALIKWNNLTEEPYIFVYTLHYNAYIVNYAKYIADIQKCKVVLIVSSLDNFDDSSVQVIVDAGPEEWLGWVKNAKMVLTDSYHCTAFSILFCKDFITICTKKMVSDRIITLLSMFSLEEHYINVNTSFDPEIAKFDHEPVLSILAKERLHSFTYLKKVLEL